MTISSCSLALAESTATIYIQPHLWCKYTSGNTPGQVATAQGKQYAFTERNLISLNFSNIQTRRGVLGRLEKNRKTLILPQCLVRLVAFEGAGMGPGSSAFPLDQTAMETQPSNGNITLPWKQACWHLPEVSSYCMAQDERWAECMSDLIGPSGTSQHEPVSLPVSMDLLAVWISRGYKVLRAFIYAVPGKMLLNVSHLSQASSPSSKWMLYSIHWQSLPYQITLRKCPWAILVAQRWQQPWRAVSDQIIPGFWIPLHHSLSIHNSTPGERKQPNQMAPLGCLSHLPCFVLLSN